MSKLAEWRKSRGMTQRQLADLVGCTQSTIDRYEHGRIPDRHRMPAIVRATEGVVQPGDFYEQPAEEAAA